MKLYILLVLVLAFVLRNHTGSLIWLSAISVFVPIKYAKDFIDKHMR